MFASLVCAAVLAAPGIERLEFGVPLIRAQNPVEAWKLYGQAVAEDRLWQMELSRRQSRGTLEDLIGEDGVASDDETARTGYTDAELQMQLDRLPDEVRAAFDAYAEGVNLAIQTRIADGSLPEGYGDRVPEPWTALDSAAISVQLMRRFGTGGAGELRNLALLEFLRTRQLGDGTLDAFDDLAWQNAPTATTTLDPQDDPQAEDPPILADFDRADTERHLAALPSRNLFELLPAVQLSVEPERERFAMAHGLPYKWGSYAAVVSPERSATGDALLMTAPQMGHATPNVIHEAIIDAPGLQVQGVGVPGIPAIAIGHTPEFAWGLTSGVADVEDIFAARLTEGGYVYGDEVLPIEEVEVAGRIQRRTHHGPIVFESRVGEAIYSKASAWWMRELDAIAGLHDAYSAKTVDELLEIRETAPVTFNLFYAFRDGTIGWHYLGSVPIRASGWDPRLPTPSHPDNEWRGYLAPERMPQVQDPADGLIVNWNNKPVAWWPNLDTPVWGELFRDARLRDALDKPKLGITDLELGAWEIARRETDTLGAFSPHFTKSSADADPSFLAQLSAFDGWNLDRSRPARAYVDAVRALRIELFEPSLSNMFSADLFETVLQPSLILRALEGRTELDYLDGRTVESVVDAALLRASDAWVESDGPQYLAPSIGVPVGPRIPYNVRGTTIRHYEVGDVIYGRAVLSPGNAESGEHSADQVPLARAWTYRPLYSFD